MALMSTMSVCELSLFCRYMGESTSRRSKIGIREQYFSTLLQALRNVNGDNPDVPKNPDTRSLDSHYNKILPACDLNVVFEEITKIEKPEKMADRARRRGYKGYFNAVVFPNNGIGKKMTPYKFVLDGNCTLFSLDVMRRFSLNHSSLKINADNLIQDLARPLARRLNNRREGEILQDAFYRCLIICIKNEPSIAKSLDYPMISYAIRAWGRADKKKKYMTSYLGTLIRVITYTYPWTLDRISTELRHVKRSLRPELFSLLLGHALPFKLDFRLPFHTDPRALRCLGKAWPPKLFYLLPSGISLRFFKFLSEIHPDGKFIARDCGAENGIKYIDCNDKQYGDADVLLALLHSRQTRSDPPEAAWLMGTHRTLQQRTSKTQHAQNAEETASWVQSAILVSLASGALFLYEDTVLWVRKLGGDFLVAKGLIPSNILLSQECLDTLSGMSRSIFQFHSLVTPLKGNIERANRVLMQYLEMFASYHGPSLSFSQGVLDAFHLASSVIQQRIERLRDYQKEIGLSDDEVYSYVWEPSIDMLVNAERLLLKIKDEYSSRDEFKFPLWHLSLPNKLELHVRKFLDTLGQSRDKLWQEYRAEKNPAINELEAPWPRGLPIQHLVPNKLSNWKDMPYIESRAKAIVFAPGGTLKSLVPTQVEKKRAIGPFVDDFIFALHVFISAVDEGPQQEDRVLQAWDYAVGNFTCEHMPHKVALWYWKHFFSLAPNLRFPDTVTSRFETPDFEYLDYDRSGVIVQWTPHLKPAQYPLISTVADLSRQFPKSCLDCMLMVHKLESFKIVHLTFEACNLEIIRDVSVPSIWDFWKPRGLSPLERTDAIIAMSVAALHGKFGLNSRLFKQSLPSEDDSRFPALLLDEKFLKQQVVDLSSVMGILERLSLRIPVFLFQRLARSLWERFDTEATEDLEVLKAAMGVVKMTLRGDRPDAAQEFIIRGIFKHKEAKL